MSDTAIALTLDTALIEQLDAIADARKATRAEIIALACQELVRQLGHLNTGARERPAAHAVDVSPAAAALWEASWIDSPIEPEAAE